MPRFSVIIPTYHRNDLLAKCLDCLAPGVQTLAPEQYEVIVTDDGSETTAEQLVKTQYPWATWVPGPRQGPAANRNNGASFAKGEWLVFTDDDCLPDPNWLKAYAEAIAPDIWVYEGKTTCNAGLRSPLEHAPINLIGGCLWSCNMMIHKPLFEKIGRFDENFRYPHLEDIDLQERLHEMGQATTFTNRAVVDHPPKRLPSGRHLGAYHENDLYFCFSRKKAYPSLQDILVSIARFRIRRISNYSFSRNSIAAFISMIAEMAYVFQHFKEWQSRLQSY
jgi:GT2 family glycosyltransferase